MIYFFDFGHGGKDPGAVYRGGKEPLNEKDIVYQIGVKTTNRMRELGATVKLTRKGDEYLTLQERTNKSNKEMGANGLFVSFHTNSFKESRANGVETFHFAGSSKGKKAATKVQNELKKVFKTDRGVKTARFYVLRKTAAPSILMELGFISNAEDRKVMLNRQDEIVEAIVRGLCAYEGRAYTKKGNPIIQKPTKPNSKGTSILGKSTVTIQQMQDWASKKKANPTFIKLAPVFYEVSIRNGVNPGVTYVQSAKETGYMKFGGVLDETFKNPCGLKISQGGGDKDPNAHKRFKTWEDGIQAQVDHLALYAGAKGYPKKDTPDPRHFAYLHGKCKTVESLGGNWAPSKQYGTDLVKMLTELERTPKKKDEKNTVKISIFGHVREVKGVVKGGTSYMYVGKDLVPIRDVFEGLGFYVGWDTKRRMVVIA